MGYKAFIQAKSVASSQSPSLAFPATSHTALTIPLPDLLYLSKILEPIDAVPNISSLSSHIFETISGIISLLHIPSGKILHILEQWTSPHVCGPLGHSTPLSLLTLFAGKEYIPAALYIQQSHL